MNHNDLLDDDTGLCNTCQEEHMEEELIRRYSEYNTLCENAEYPAMSYEDWLEWDRNVYQKHVRETPNPLSPATFQRMQDDREGNTPAELQQMVEEFRQENEELIAELNATQGSLDTQRSERKALENKDYARVLDWLRATYDDMRDEYNAPSHEMDVGAMLDVVSTELHNLQNDYIMMVKELQDTPIRVTPSNQTKFPHYFIPVPENTTHLDIYWFLKAWNVTDPCVQHAIKKLFCAGQRGVKDNTKDYNEAIDSIKRAIELEGTK